jgi:hypothetical protein
MNRWVTRVSQVNIVYHRHQIRRLLILCNFKNVLIGGAEDPTILLVDLVDYQSFTGKY